LLVLDEPFAGLDPVNLQLLRDAVLSLRDEGTTVIFSTHDMHVAEQMCDTVFMIFNGRKVLDGSLESIQRQYPAGRVKVRLVGNAPLRGGLPGVQSIEAARDGHVLRLETDCDPQSILRHLSAEAPIEHFEIVRPTLHDIFVDIARPPAAS
jgi:ABC-2 type transport system ATP-binding protein